MNTKHTDGVEASEIAKQINNGLAMMLTPSNEAMQACRWVKAEVERAITTLQTTHSQQVEVAVRKIEKFRCVDLVYQEGYLRACHELREHLFKNTELQHCIECGEIVQERGSIRNCHGSCRIEV